MISGSITLYKEPEKPTHHNQYSTDLDDYWSNETVESEIDSCIADAMAKGYMIGRKVRLRNCQKDQTGVIIHFRKGAYAYEPYSGKHQILTVRWNSNYEMHYNQDKLELLNEDNQNHLCSV